MIFWSILAVLGLGLQVFLCLLISMGVRFGLMPNIFLGVYSSFSLVSDWGPSYEKMFCGKLVLQQDTSSKCDEMRLIQ